MLLDLTVQNFRKHAERTIHFTPGINAIRAANEAGKSTLCEAIAYAYFGTAGLKEAIDDVVTYGVPVNKLRVEHGFELAGVNYRVVRSPKGAELYANGNDKPLVTGQKEVTKFVEKLFGTSQAMATKLMLARQKDLGAALAGGPTEAGRMIEALADLDLIDELVGLVSEQLPCGDTAAVKGSIEYLRGEAEPGELPDLAPLEAAVGLAHEQHAEALDDYETAKTELDALPVDDARKVIEQDRALRTSIEHAGRQLAALQEELDAELPAAPSDEEIAALRTKVELQKQAAAALALRTELEKIEISQWDEPLETLHDEIGKVEGVVALLSGKIGGTESAVREAEAKLQRTTSDYKVRKAELEGRIVKDETCAFCGKDLKDVPEVALVNNPLFAKLEELTRSFEGAKTELQDVIDAHTGDLPALKQEKAQQEAYLKDLRAVLDANDRAELLYARAEAFITLDRKCVPALWTWTGPGGMDTDYAGMLREVESKRDAALRAAERRDQQKKQAAALTDQVGKQRLALMQLDAISAASVLGQEVELRVRVQRLLEGVQQAERALASAQQALGLARGKREQLLAAAEKAKKQLEAAQAQLVEIEANNLLVKKLRAARPAITDKLWSLVLGSVSAYAAKIRGEVSTITRVDGRFKINGHPVSGLSGSAEDSLGLSIRYALTRTFLPNIDFAMLDEPAAACNDEREIAMLGMIATAGFAQTVLITHSQLADSFADNIISF